jgi:hypothetical protein
MFFECLLQFKVPVARFFHVRLHSISKLANTLCQIVMAAGNDGHKGSSTVYSPATAKNVLSVGASELSMTAYVESGAIYKPDYWMRVQGFEPLFPLQPAIAGFGPTISTDSKVSGYVVFAQPSDGCAALEIKMPLGFGVVVKRGNCTFTKKAENAQVAGAAFMIVSQMDFGANGQPYCTEPPCAAITMTFPVGYDKTLLKIPACMVMFGCTTTTLLKHQKQ